MTHQIFIESCAFKGFFPLVVVVVVVGWSGVYKYCKSNMVLTIKKKS